MIPMNQDRREFLGTALMTIVAAKLGIPEPRSAFGPVHHPGEPCSQ